MIDSREASAALDDINEVVARLRQSHIYEIASLIMIACGVMVFAGNILTFVVPRHGGYVWIGINVLNVAIVAVISVTVRSRIGARSFDGRVLAAFLMFYGFGILCTVVLGHFGGRELGTFWPVYFMLFYSIAGLWFGWPFLAIGLSITALTLIGYFFIGGAAFLLWMAAVNGGGLILGGSWMRWGE
jgi:hypothetical protein